MAHRLVIIDDHKVLRDGIRLFLERAGVGSVVGEASDTEEGRQCIAQLRPDAILLDLNLPGEGGIAVAEWVRENHPSTRVLILTASTDTAVVQTCLAAGVRGFLRKNCGGNEIVDAINVVMRGETYLSQSVSSALAASLHPGPSGHAAPYLRLSKREIEVLRGIASGLSYKEIAVQMNIGVRSVETYRARLASKTGCRTKVALAKFAVNQGLGGT
jgi:DNA-binding NarL/FixJ family response regulator